MKQVFQNILLSTIATLIAFGIFYAIGGVKLARGYLYQKSFSALSQEGSAFETVTDLRKNLVERNEKDLKSDGSVSLRSIIRPHPSDSIIYELIPGLDTKFQGVPVKINSLGMRGPEVQEAKPADTYRIVLLGDSFTFGWGVEEDKIFARVIERELNKKFQEAKFQGKNKVVVLNFGIPGYSTFQEVALFKERGLKFSPDAVIVYFIDNDYYLPFFIKNMESLSGIVEMSKISSYNKSENEDVQAKKKALFGMLSANNALRRLADFTTEHGIKLFVAINPGRHANRDWKRLKVLRKRKDITPILLRDDFLKFVKDNNIDPETLQLPNDPHPNAQKHEILGTLITNKIAEELLKNSK